MKFGEINSFGNLIKFAWNSPTITTWGNFFFASVKAITVLPLLLNRFGSEEIAVWLLFASVITFGNILDFGFGSTFSRVVSYAISGANSIEGFRKRAENETADTPNWRLMASIYGTMGYIFAAVAIIATLLLATIGSWAVAETISASLFEKELWFGWGYLVISMGIFIYGRKYGTALHGMNYVTLVNRWNMLFSLLAIIFSIIVIIIYNSILLLIITQQTFTILSIIRDRFLLKSTVHDKRFVHFVSFRWDQDTFRSVWGPSWRSAVGMLASSGVVELTGLIYAQVANADNLISYLLALRILGLINGVSRAPFYSKLPQYTKLRANGQIAELSARAKLGIQISLYFFVLGTSTVGLLIEPVLSLINANAHFVPTEMWVLLSTIGFLERHHAMHAQLYGTTNHIPFYIPIAIGGVVTITLSLYLLSYVDYWAFPISQGVANILISNWWNVKISLKSLEVAPLQYLRQSFIYPAFVFTIIQVLLLNL